MKLTLTDQHGNVSMSWDCTGERIGFRSRNQTMSDDQVTEETISDILHDVRITMEYEFDREPCPGSVDTPVTSR